MVKKYFIDLFKRFNGLKPLKKLLILCFIFLQIFILIISFGKTDYNIIAPGFLTDASQTIVVDTENEKGFIQTVSVMEYNKVSIIKYWIAKNENRVQIEKANDDDLTPEEDNTYGVISKKVAINNAIIVAYNKAKLIDDSIVLASEFKGMIVAIISNDVETSLKADDIITKINGVDVTSKDAFYDEYYKLVGTDRLGGTKSENDIITLSVLRYSSISQKYISYDNISTKIYRNSNGLLSLGITIYEYTVIDGANSNPKVEINYNETLDSRGGSGGAMMTLSVYNALLKEDITKGLGIAGTGTINNDGTIGAIGAIEQKVVKAYISQVDVFYVDSYDYDDAIKACEKFGYDSKFIIKVSTIDDIINDLKGR